MNVIVLERVEGEMDSGSFKLQKGNDIFELAFDMGGTLAFLAINGDEVLHPTFVVPTDGSTDLFEESTVENFIPAGNFVLTLSGSFATETTAFTSTSPSQSAPPAAPTNNTINININITINININSNANNNNNVNNK